MNSLQFYCYIMEDKQIKEVQVVQDFPVIASVNDYFIGAKYKGEYIASSPQQTFLRLILDDDCNLTLYPMLPPDQRILLGSMIGVMKKDSSQVNISTLRDGIPFIPTSFRKFANFLKNSQSQLYEFQEYSNQPLEDGTAQIDVRTFFGSLWTAKWVHNPLTNSYILSKYVKGSLITGIDIPWSHPHPHQHEKAPEEK